MNDIILDATCSLVVTSVRYFTTMDICFDIESLPSELARDTLSVFSVLLTAEDLTLGVLVAIFLCSGIFFGFCTLTPTGKKSSKQMLLVLNRNRVKATYCV